LTPRAYSKPPGNFAFGLQMSNTNWIPHTPRQEYVERFMPTKPHSNWMTGLRIESSHERIGDIALQMTELEDQRKIKRLHTSQKKNKGEVINTKRQRFFKLLKGGDVPRIA
jgi:hypothetical protein